MSQRTTKIFLEDIIQSIDKIDRFTQGMSYEDFEQNELVIDGVLRNIEIIGEAARNIPDSLRATSAHIRWRRMVGLRNLVIHAYFNVDLTIIWQIITVNFPDVKDHIIDMLANFSESSIYPEPHENQKPSRSAPNLF